MVMPPPWCTYGEYRISGDYSPALRARDWKDPLLVIEYVQESDTADG